MKKNPRLLGLRDARKAMGLTLDQCARHLFVHMRTVSAWEQGRCAPPINEAQDIAGRLGVRLDVLLGTVPVDPEPVDPEPVDTEGGESYNGVV